MGTYNSLQMREVFHMEFLRQLARKVKDRDYAVKGGVNTVILRSPKGDEESK